MNLGQWVGFLALAIALYFLWQIRQIILLFFTAIILATALNQLVKRFQRSRLKRSWSVLLSLLIALGVLVLFFGLIIPPFIDQFQELLELLPQALEQIEESTRWIEEQLLGGEFLEVPDFSVLFEQLQPLAREVIEQSIDFFRIGVTTVLQIILVLVLILMLLGNPTVYRNGFVRLFPSFYRQRVDRILFRCQEALENWSVGTLIEMIFIAILSGAGLLILQVPLALAHALLAGLLNFIPNIGPTLSVALPMAVAFLEAPWKALAVLVLYIVIQQIESYWLTPTVMAKQVALPPAVTLTAQLIFASIFGVLGLLIALPLTVVARIWLEEVLIKDILDRWDRTKGS